MTRKNFRFFPRFIFIFISFEKSEIKFEIPVRYNLTHFHDPSEIFETVHLQTKYMMLADNRFENHVISNLDGKLRNRNIDLITDCELGLFKKIHLSLVCKTKYEKHTRQLLLS